MLPYKQSCKGFDCHSLAHLSPVSPWRSFLNCAPRAWTSIACTRGMRGMRGDGSTSGGQKSGQKQATLGNTRGCLHACRDICTSEKPPMAIGAEHPYSVPIWPLRADHWYDHWYDVSRALRQPSHWRQLLRCISFFYGVRATAEA